MLNQKDMHELRKAYNTLENPGFRIKAMNTIGKPIEKGIELLPDPVEHQIAKACNITLKKAADLGATGDFVRTSY